MYWFCPTCHQEMPHADTVKINNSRQKKKTINLIKKLFSYILKEPAIFHLYTTEKKRI
jgi:hypothetical protein